jgi:exonuclease 3'-5' domain-containing protein 1
MTFSERNSWKLGKEKGLNLFAPERGGSYEVFNLRPLAQDIMQYCVQDVQFLPRLWQKYNRKLSPRWTAKVEAEVKNRVLISKSATYNGKGRHMALAPKDW